MADPQSSPVTPETGPGTSESEQPDLQSIQSDPSHPLPVPSSSSIPSSLPHSSSTVASAPLAETLTSNPPLVTPPLPVPFVQSFAPSLIAPGAIPPSAPSFRPVTPIPLSTPQFSPLPNPNFLSSNIQNPNVQPPGVNPVAIMLPGAASGAGNITVSVSPLRPAGVYQAPPGPLHNSAMRPYPQMPNGFPMAPSVTPQGTVHPPGIPRFPTPYPAMVRPAFPPHPPGVIGVLPPLSRPPIPGIRPPIVPPVVRPVVSIVPPTEKPQTTVYVGKIAATVENDFMHSLLRLCGDVKAWKRAQDPSDGTPRGFGFCEFESAEGVLRALRLLTKFNIDGQELVLNVNQATREYLERYVEKKTERENKPKETETETEGTEKEEESQPVSEKSKPQKTSEENLKKDENDSADKENQDTTTFGIVNDEDREADRDALEKLTSMIEERIKTKPPPLPPAPTTANGSAKSNSEVPSKSRDGDSDVDIMKSDAAEDKNDDDTTSESKPSNEHDKSETSSPGRSRRYDRRSRDRDREQDLRREKERELERYERERERERVRRERNRELKIREAERLFKERVKEWEFREREKEYQRQHEKEREKERERERRREIIDQEDESDDDDTRKRRRRSSAYDDKRKKRQREKEDDLADSLREEEEIAEAKRRAIEEQQMQKEEPKVEVANGVERSSLPEESNAEQAYESDSGHVNHAIAVSDTRQSNNAPARKLGFGLVGSGKRTAVPSVFHEEDDDDAEKEKKMRPLVPLDYSTDELQVAQPAVSGAPSSNLAAAAEFVKRISNANPKEDRFDADKDRTRRSTDKPSHRDRDRIDDDNNRARDENREKKLLDAKQLIDMIPKTKEELFSHEINWAVYDKHELHERMRPWISKKITEFLGEEEETLVDYIVSSTKKHVQASQMLELLQSILDDEAEMFVLKMWRMLIFEIKKVETGLSLKPRA
ncbi:RNA-binding protein 25 isoform X2 [Telopea speciosissima]|uniref:RNA-binding protein 25 isoform X2 n=1 Tax=Telopea speciosissima TaxID=54955 RepID=UPI001CC46211|nr:RNA-binding protein 25 isoform X2 [Telopea speciosissima]